MPERSAASPRRPAFRASSSSGSSMRFRSFVGVWGSALLLTGALFAQGRSPPTWPEPVPNRQAIAAKDKKPAPRRSLIGMWGSMPGNRQATNQSYGVPLKAKNGRPENQLPYTPHGFGFVQAHTP